MTARSDPPEASSNQPGRYYAFLRAINVGGRRLTNDELLAPFVGLGLRDVAAYQAAGNITFVSDEPDTVRADRLEAAIGEVYGFPSSVFVRSHAELSAIGRPGPFSEDEMAGTEGRVQVGFLRTDARQVRVSGAGACQRSVLGPATRGSVDSCRDRSGI